MIRTLEPNPRCCCNCRHNIRIVGHRRIKCHCEVTNKNMGYVQVMEGWCKHWAKEKEESDEVSD